MKKTTHSVRVCKPFEDNEPDFIIITGPDGSGKTHLANQFYGHLIEEGTTPNAIHGLLKDKKPLICDGWEPTHLLEGNRLYIEIKHEGIQPNIHQVRRWIADAEKRGRWEGAASVMDYALLMVESIVATPSTNEAKVNAILKNLRKYRNEKGL